MWLAAWPLILVAWVTSLHRFRTLLRRSGADLLSQWDRVGVDSGLRAKDDASLFAQMTQRQPIAAIERWRRTVLLLMLAGVLWLAVPFILAAATHLLRIGA
jgi:hypothetical protein